MPPPAPLSPGDYMASHSLGALFELALHLLVTSRPAQPLAWLASEGASRLARWKTDEHCEAVRVGCWEGSVHRLCTALSMRVPHFPILQPLPKAQTEPEACSYLREHRIEEALEKLLAEVLFEQVRKGGSGVQCANCFRCSQ